jgi:hypothetical protein
MPTLVFLVRMPDRYVAEPLTQLLRANGIEAFILSDDAGGVHPPLGMANGTEIKVPASRLEEAQALLAAYEQAPLVED